MIHVVAAAGLGRAAMSAPIMGDYKEALAEKEEHLRVFRAGLSIKDGSPSISIVR